MKQLVSAFLFIVFYVSVAFGADRMRIAYSSISGAYIGIWAAREAGFFAKENLDDQIIFIPTATQLSQVIVAGDVDIASLGGGPIKARTISFGQTAWPTSASMRSSFSWAIPRLPSSPPFQAVMRARRSEMFAVRSR